jgi:hypothetical protein
MDPAVLAPLAGPPPDQLTRLGIYQAGSEVFKSRRALAWMMAK